LGGFAPLDQAFVAAEALAVPEIAPPFAAEAKDRVDLGLDALSQEGPRAKPSVPEEHIAGAQAIPEPLEKAAFMLMPVSGRPGREQARGQAQHGDDPKDRESAAGLLHRLLGKRGLVLGSIGCRHGGAIHGQDVVAAPQVLGRDSGIGLSHQVVVDLLQAFDRDNAPGLAVGAGFIRGAAASVDQAKRLGLANGFAARGPGLSDLPEESPKDQAQISATVTGVFLLVLLSQVPAGDKRGEERFELVEGGAEGRAQAVEVIGKGAGQGGKSGVMIGQCIYCPI
jgi:hypothetical protein